MTVRITREFIVAAALINGILASSNINRALIDMPAWHHVGAEDWAAFSRQADLSGRGMTLYPFEAFCGAILSMAAALSFRWTRTIPRSAALPIYGAVACTAAGLLATTQAAPIMLSVRNLHDPIALQQALEGFTLWGGIRGAFQVLAYLGNVWALVAVGCSAPTPRT
jgi:hypothetical protein